MDAPTEGRGVGCRRVTVSPTARYCGDEDEQAAGDGPCTWRVAEVVKRVDKNCSDDAIFSKVEAEVRR